MIFSNKTVNLLEKFKALKVIEVGQHTPVFTEINYNIQGVDGVINQGNTFAPFVVSVRFKLRARDSQQYHLVANEIRNFVTRRGDFYLQHYQLPFIKYLISKAEATFTRQSPYSGECTINFTCSTGYGLSIVSTGQLKQKDSWAMGGYLQTLEQRDYIFKNTKNFEVYNLGGDTVDVRKHHPLTITIKNVQYAADDTREVKALQIENMTTGDKFRYEKELKKTDVLKLEGVFPLLNDDHVGKDTNHNVIRIASGKNSFKLYGAEKFEITFDFNFIYR